MFYRRTPRPDSKRLLKPTDALRIPAARLAEERSFWEAMLDGSTWQARFASALISNVIETANNPHTFRAESGGIIELGSETVRIIRIRPVDHSKRVVTGLAVSQFLRRSGLAGEPDNPAPSTATVFAFNHPSFGVQACIHRDDMLRAAPGFKTERAVAWYGNGWSFVRAAYPAELPPGAAEMKAQELELGGFVASQFVMLEAHLTHDYLAR